MPTIEFGTSPSPDVRIVPFVAAQFPALAKVFPPNSAALQALSLVVENHSPRDIVGIAVRHIVSSPDGRSRNLVFRSDSFMLPSSTAVAPAGSRLLAAPGLFRLESAFPASGGFVGPSPDAISQNTDRYDGASQIAVQVDSIIFSDGEVVGPDTSHLAQEIPARKTAAMKVAAIVRAALANGTDPIAALPTPGGPRAKTDFLSKWTPFYVKQIRHSHNLEVTLSGIEKLSQPPQFYRRRPD